MKTKKQKRDAAYQLQHGYSKAVTEAFKETSEEDLYGLLTAYAQLLDTPEGCEEVTMSTEVLKQTILLASHATSIQIFKRYSRG